MLCQRAVVSRVRAVFLRCNAIVNALFWVLFYTRFSGILARESRARFSEFFNVDLQGGGR